MGILRNLLAAATLFIGLSALAGEPIDINSADAEALSTAIHGVGMKRAKAIVEYRTQHGPFQSVDDLARVQGISAKTIERNRANLMVGPTGG